MQTPHSDVEKGNAVDRLHTSITYMPDVQESSSHHTEPASRSRLPLEFRTLSIHVETKVSETGGKDGERRKRVVKG